MQQFFAALAAFLAVVSQGNATAHGPLNQSGSTGATGTSAISGPSINGRGHAFGRLIQHETGNETEDADEEEGPTGPTGVSGSLGPSGASGSTGPTGPTGPNTTRVPAINLRSGKDMPTLIPVVAIEHSGALDFSTGNQTENGTGNSTGHQGRGNNQ